MERSARFGDWSEHMSSSGKKYYYNCKTEVSQWEKPREWISRTENRQRQSNDYSSRSSTSNNISLNKFLQFEHDSLLTVSSFLYKNTISHILMIMICCFIISIFIIFNIKGIFQYRISFFALRS